MFYVYILYSKCIDRYYIGSTSVAPELRLKKHLTNHKGYTSRTKDWVLVYTEPYNSKAESLFREQKLKSLKNRNAIETLVLIKKST